MRIKNLKNYENLFLILASLLIAIMYTLPFLSGIFKATPDNENPWLNTHFLITRSIWYTIQSFVSILVIAYFNYKGKDRVLPSRFPQWVKTTLLIIYNVVLIYLLLEATVLVAEYTIGNPFGQKKAFIFNLWRYAAIYPAAVLMAYVLSLLTRTRIVEIENAKLKEENISSQLKSLKDQINPHFLFNTLNTLSSIIRLESKEEGLKFVQGLSSVYRYILESDKNNLVTIQHELEFLDSYLYMLKKRFDDKLLVMVEISPNQLQNLIPPMAIQTLIENAIKHNEVSTASPLKIKIYNEDGYIVVRNNLQEKKNDQENLGLGLPNLLKRYRLLTGKDIIIQQDNNSFVVKIPIVKEK